MHFLQYPLFLYFISFLQEYILQHKQHCQHIHQQTDFLLFCFTSQKIQHYIGNNTHGDTFRNTIEKWHCSNTDITWQCLSNIVEVNVSNICQHIKSNHYQSWRCCKRRNCKENWRQEQRQSKKNRCCHCCQTCSSAF